MCEMYNCLPSEVNQQDPMELWAASEVRSALNEKHRREAEMEAKKKSNKKK